MKIVLQAIVASIIIHGVYILSTLVFAYIKTKYYAPDISNAGEPVYMLQNEVAFGFINSPIISLVSFAGVTIICVFILVLYKRFLYLKI